jgi:hypothetical protein
MKKLIDCIFICLFCILIKAGAQPGYPFITNFKLNEYIDRHNFDIYQDPQGIMYFANRQGILTYDAEEWQFIKTPFMPYTLKSTSNNSTIYVCGRNDIGYIQQDATGDQKVETLISRDLEPGLVTNIVADDEHVYFQSDNSIFRFKGNDLETYNQWKSIGGNAFSGLVKHQGKVYVNLEGAGLNIIENDSIYPIDKGIYLANEKIVFSFQLDSVFTLIGMNNNKLYTFDGENISHLPIEDSTFIEKGNLSGGVRLNQNLIALSTQVAGCLIIDPKTGKTEHYLNTHTGLPDNEIYAIFTDRQEGLWVTHPFGISRADYAFPIKCFSNYPGLKGNMITLNHSGNTLYVGTTEGLFYLKRIEEYEQKEITKKIRKKVLVPAQKEPIATLKAEVQEEPEEPKKFRLFRKKGSAAAKKDSKEDKDKNTHVQKIFGTEKETETEREENTKSKKKYEYHYQLKKEIVFELEGIRYAYQPIEGISHKCKKILPTQNGVLAITNTAIYLVKDLEAKQIFSTSYIHDGKLFNNKLFLATHKGIETIGNINAPKLNHQTYSLDFPVYSLCMNDSNNLYAGGEDFGYRFVYEDGQITGPVKEYYFESDITEFVKVSCIHGSTANLVEECNFRGWILQKIFSICC